MSDAAALYTSAKRSFMNGQYNDCLRKISELQEISHGNGDHISILSANLFIARLLHKQADLNEEEAYDHIERLRGICSHDCRSRSVASFCKNLVLFQISKRMYNSALAFIEFIQTNIPDCNIVDLLASLALLKQDASILPSTAFSRLWERHLMNDAHSVLQLAGEFPSSSFMPFLKGFSLMKLGKWQEALRAFSQSIECRYRIAESLNCSGICSFHLAQTRDAVDYFERAIRSSTIVSIPVFNLAETCGFLGRSFEQQTLLQFYVRLEKSYGRGSFSTLYILAKMSMKTGDWRTAVERYQFIMDEAVATGIDLPSPTFALELAHALNKIGDPNGALEILPVSDDTTTQEVLAHAHFLRHDYDECRDIISRIKTPEALANTGILEYMTGNNQEAYKLLNEARKQSPKNMDIVRNTVLILLANPAMARGASATWLTACGYQLNHDAEYYENLLEGQFASEADPLTTCTLTIWRDYARSR